MTARARGRPTIGDSAGDIADDPAGRGEPIDLGILPELIGFRLRTAQVAVFQHFNRALATAKISPPQFGTLLLIAANRGISQSAVASALRFDRSTLVQIIDRLEGRGLVVRESSTRDRRSHALRLTARGERLTGELKRAVLAHEETIAATLSPEERAALRDLLARVQRAADGAAG